MRLVLSIAIAFIWSSSAMAISFFTGNNFNTTLITGSVQVQCVDASGSVRNVLFQCRASQLDPVETDFFIGPVGVNADQVAFSSKLETGDVRTANVAYSSISNRSIDKLNLWVDGLLTRPLLAIGINQVSYKMYLAGQVVNQGVFNVSVSRNPPVMCPRKTYNSYIPSDCDSQFSMCARYFSDLNFCQ